MTVSAGDHTGYFLWCGKRRSGRRREGGRAASSRVLGDVQKNLRETPLNPSWLTGLGFFVFFFLEPARALVLRQSSFHRASRRGLLPMLVRPDVG